MEPPYLTVASHANAVSYHGAALPQRPVGVNRLLRGVAEALILVSLLARPAAAQPLQCRARGPCTFLDTLGVLLPPGEEKPVLVANFGLLREDGAGRIRFSCEAGLGGLAARARIAPWGELFLGSDDGLARASAGCPAARPALAGQAVLDVAFDPGPPRRVWALTPGAVQLSTDGGARFVPLARFAAGEAVFQLLAGSPLYAAGEREGRLLLARSDDGGATFTRAAAAPPGIPLALLAVDPLLVAVRQGDADEVWRSTDGGGSWQRALALADGEILGGFAASPAALFVAGRRSLLDGAAPSARLYRSRDRGATFEAPLPSGPAGPRYRCLGFKDDRLYACGGGAVNDDAFLLGSSRDEGASWTPLLTTEALAGPEPCVAAACAPTSEWLCDTYRICGATADAGSAPAAAARGCQCAAAPAGGAPLWLPLLLLARLRRLFTARSGRP
jgi:MYXO-CTERM domain-containing protein